MPMDLIILVIGISLLVSGTCGILWMDRADIEEKIVQSIQWVNRRITWWHSRCLRHQRAFIPYAR